MSKTIEEIKEEVAKDFLHPYRTWLENSRFSNDENISVLEDSGAIDEVAKRYAQSQTKELQDQNAELVDMYKECFEMFIPSDKWDEATEFLSTYGSGLAKDLYRKEKHNHLNKKP